MKLCPEGAYTAGQLWMTGFGGLMLGIVVTAILRNLGYLRDPPSGG